MVYFSHPDSSDRLQSTTVVTSSWHTFEGTLKETGPIVAGASMHVVAAEYPYNIQSKVLLLAEATVPVVAHFMRPMCSWSGGIGMCTLSFPILMYMME